MGEEEVKVLGVRLSPFHQRVEIALKLKGVEYEYVEEDLKNKSQQLLRLNPVYKKIPVLIHRGKPLPESLLIMEYIDETWKHHPLLPAHPYYRAQLRFWANFIDTKLTEAFLNAIMKEGEEGERAKEVMEGELGILEKEMEAGNWLFEAKSVGYLELVGIFIAYWFPSILEAAGKEILTQDKFPYIWAWAQRILGFSVILETLPTKDTLLAFYQAEMAAIRKKDLQHGGN